MSLICILAVCCGGEKNGDTLSKTEMNLLGTVCTITVYGGRNADLDEAYARIREIESRMSLTRADSEIALINKAAGVQSIAVSDDTYSVIKQGIAFSSMGNGAFDISVQPLTALWGIGTQNARVPSSKEVLEALSRLNYRAVRLSDTGRTVFLTTPGMGLDLGALAKGYSADEAARVLKSRGVGAALINLGGNILTVGRKPDGTKWRIGVQNPEKPRGDAVGYVEIEPMSVVTSGVYERYFESNGVRYHHIFDTRTGYPVHNGLLAVTIVTQSSMIADGYSTLAFALGLKKGREIVEKSPDDVEAVFITEARDIYVTPGLRSRFRLTDSTYSLKGW
jgi:thiamine biosynthesis lipoprotein